MTGIWLFYQFCIFRLCHSKINHISNPLEIFLNYQWSTHNCYCKKSNLQYGSNVIVLLMIDVFPRSSIAWHDMIVPLSNFVIVFIVNLLLLISPLLFLKYWYIRFEVDCAGQRWTIELQVKVMSSPTNGCSGWMDNVGLSGFSKMFREEHVYWNIYSFIKYNAVI